MISSLYSNFMQTILPFNMMRAARTSENGLCLTSSSVAILAILELEALRVQHMIELLLSIVPQNFNLPNGGSFPRASTLEMIIRFTKPGAGR